MEHGSKEAKLTFSILSLTYWMDRQLSWNQKAISGHFQLDKFAHPTKQLKFNSSRDRFQFLVEKLTRHLWNALKNLSGELFQWYNRLCQQNQSFHSFGLLQIQLVISLFGLFLARKWGMLLGLKYNLNNRFCSWSQPE